MQETEYKYERTLHHLIAVTGGVMAGCALFNRFDVMGCAQTANLIYLVRVLIGQNWVSTLIHLGAFGIYFGTNVLFVVLRDRTRLPLQLISMLLTSLALLLSGFIPADVYPALALYPVFLASAFQWDAFPGADGYVSSTIFSTNNTKQSAMALTEFALHHDRQKLDKAMFFFGSLLFFHVGVACACLLSDRFGIHASWPGLLLQIPAYLLLFRKMRSRRGMQRLC